MNFKDNLKKIRKDNNLSQEQLAEKLGISRQSVSKWESGIAYPEMDKVLQLCQMFNLNLDELLNKDINEVKNNREKKKSINKFVDSFLSYITKTIDMFSSMKLVDKLKCIFEQMIILLLLIIVFLIIEAIGSHVIENTFSFLPNRIYMIIYDIFSSIYLIISLILGLILLFHIFKTRYLDYYLILENDVSNSDTEKKDELKNSKKIVLEKKEKVIIRDPNHTGYSFINSLTKCLLFIIKIFCFFIGMIFCFTFVMIIILLVTSFMVLNNTLLFIGIILVLLGTLLLNFIILVLIYKYIYNKGYYIQTLAILFICSLILAGIGSGLTISSISNIKIKKLDKESLITNEYHYDMSNDLIINDYENIDFVESDNEDIKIVYNHSKFFNLTNYKEDNIIYIFHHEDFNEINIIKEIINDINNGYITNYFNYSINIYTTKENIDILKNNLIKYEEYDREIDELYEEIEEKNETIYELEDEISDLNDELDSLNQEIDYD